MELITLFLQYAIKTFEYVLFVYLGLSCSYVFVFAIAGHFYKSKKHRSVKKFNKMAVLIPAYKEDAVIVEVAKSALHQNYPKDKFDVVVIADSLKMETLNALKSLPVQLVEVHFKQSTKAKALNKAMADLSNTYDHAIVLDADNLMEAHFLLKMNAAFEDGCQIIQGHRTAKNKNTSFAILDAASEEINNFIFRQGHRAMGLSSGLIGSGMGFEYGLFKNVMSKVSAIGGFDKELEFKFAKAKITIEYLKDALVFDEKIQKGSDFSNQRKRWLATQFIYLSANFKQAWTELFLNYNLTYFDKVIQLLVPPRLILLGITGLVTLIYAILHGIGSTQTAMTYLWMASLTLVFTSFLLALPKSFYTIKTIRALAVLPMAFGRMLLLLFKLKGANRKFIHTTHSIVKN
ncbi:glycosyltransferase [Algibacter mikhailovii]|uniref:Glycosyl transferase n=1 Tax=Algibacter mikhailovii TaxID=425498 RepID=A0A918RCC3_9FLAO|nr:glycosyltransferase family 2 protein [Algibacter mikhailovii]GGZ93151.1 glycosyl transferase [Algibacter mikhailovii]